jgi:hypothetical protein
MPPPIIDPRPLSVVPEFAKPIVYAWGLATLNWGKMETQLELLLHVVNREEYKLGYRKFPTTSFRLKSELFQEWYAEHPLFASVHHLAKPVCRGLLKANKSRLNLTHSSGGR